MAEISRENQDALTQARLKSLLRYEPDTGKFFWRVARPGVRKDREAGWVESNGYRRIHVNSRRYRSPRLAFLYMVGMWPTEYVDHINRDRSDDRWDNLRECTPAENKRNMSKTARNTSGVVGVSFRKDTGKWCAQIKLQRRSYHLGYFDTIEEASEARAKAVAKYHGEFAADHSQAVG